MKKCYADGSRVNISWFQGSGYGFIEASKNMGGFAPHKIYNTEIWTNNDKAVAVMMVTVQIRYIIDGYSVELLSDSKLVFRLQKTGGQWYIVSFDAIYEKDTMIPVFPNSQIKVSEKEMAKYRQSYGGMIYMGKKNGIQVSEELSGIDRPDLVDKLYRDADKWLAE